MIIAEPAQFSESINIDIVDNNDNSRNSNRNEDNALQPMLQPQAVPQQKKIKLNV